MESEEGRMEIYEPLDLENVTANEFNSTTSVFVNTLDDIKSYKVRVSLIPITR